MKSVTTAYLFADGHVVVLREKIVKLAGKRTTTLRSEERRVGKEGRSRWSPDH